MFGSLVRFDVMGTTTASLVPTETTETIQELILLFFNFNFYYLSSLNDTLLHQQRTRQTSEEKPY